MGKYMSPFATRKYSTGRNRDSGREVSRRLLGAPRLLRAECGETELNAVMPGQIDVIVSS